MNRFYQYNIAIQWTVALLLLVPLVVLIIVWSQKSLQNPLLYPALVLMVPFIQFFLTPFATLTGMYTYLSPMLLVFGASEKKYELHAGTSFDYLLVMTKTPAGLQAQRRILSYFMDGLLRIVDKIAAGDLPPTIVISGSSYFFSEHTAKRLGFEIKNPSVPERLNVYLNMIDLFWMYCYAQGKLTFPPLGNIKKAEIKGSTLVENKANLERLRSLLSRAEVVDG